MIQYFCSSIAKPDGYTEIVATRLKKDIKNTKRLIFIPSIPEDKIETSHQIEKHLAYFNMIGIQFEEVVDITKEINNDNLKEIVINSDVIILGGGNPLIQMDYIKKHGLDVLMKDFNNVIIGISAGAMCMSEYIIITPCSEEYPKKIIKKGMNLSAITIFPHFNITNINQKTIDNDLEIIEISDIEEISKNISPIYLLADIPNSCILRATKTRFQILDGTAYIIKDGKISAYID